MTEGDTKSRRQARVSLALSLLSLMLHATAVVFLIVAARSASQTNAGRSVPLEEYFEVVAQEAQPAIIADVAGTAVALGGIILAIIATRRRQWGPALVTAWILNVLGACITTGMWML